MRERTSRISETYIELLHFNQLIIPGTQADLFAVFQAGPPLRIGVGIPEVIVVMWAVTVQMIAEYRIGQWLRPETGICAGLINSHRIEGGKHANIRQHGSVIGPVAVTDRRHILYQADMEVGTAVADRLGILRHLLVQNSDRVILQRIDGIKVAGADTAAAADTVFRINIGFPLAVIVDAVVGTAELAFLTAPGTGYG